MVLLMEWVLSLLEDTVLRNVPSMYLVEDARYDSSSRIYDILFEKQGVKVLDYDTC